MLKIFNALEPFFKDNYRRVHVREYARIQAISPPAASALLWELEKEGLLLRENEKQYIYYVANKENKLFIDLSRCYWSIMFQKLGLLEHLEKELLTPTVVLFGSFAKAEIKEGSDIDIAVFTPSKKVISLAGFEKKLHRKIQLFFFRTPEEIKNKDLLANILSGYLLLGDW